MTTGFSLQADQIRSGAELAHDQIRNKTNLTVDARRVQHAQVQAAASQKMDDLQASDASDATANVKRLTATAYGVGDLTRGASPADAASIAITARDAGDRADLLADQQSAMAMLTRAEQTGDETLARAVAQVAAMNNWADVLSTFCADRPVQAAAINQLQEIGNTGQKMSLADLFNYALPTPPELGSLTPFQIEQLASDPDNLLAR
jgi:hypothetical protein